MRGRVATGARLPPLPGTRAQRWLPPLLLPPRHVARARGRRCMPDLGADAQRLRCVCCAPFYFIDCCVMMVVEY